MAAVQAPTKEPGAQLMTPARQVVAIDLCDDRASAVATSPVLTSEYTAAVPSRGLPIVASVVVAPGSVSQPRVRPALCTVSTITATTMALCGPISSSDAKSTAYATDMAEPLAVNGNVRLIAAVTEARATSAANSTG